MMSSDDFLTLLVFGPIVLLCVMLAVEWWRS